LISVGCAQTKGAVKVAALLTELAADSAMLMSARAMFNQMGVHIGEINESGW
jgi:hypothetical protein